MDDRLDLRDSQDDDHRQVLFDALSELDAGDGIEIVAEADLDSHLVRYQIDHDRHLEWTYAHPDEEPRELTVRMGESMGDERGTIDVRDLKPQRRHEALLSIFNELSADEGFVLVNDHDPKPLYYELESMHGDVVGWEYRQQGGSDGWQVDVVKTAESDAEEVDVVTRYDVREIPKPERHPTIHHRYGMVPEGGALELIAPHEPRPLHQEFDQRYGDAFSWEIVEQEPGRCLVRITKQGADASEDGDSDDETIEIIEELDVRDLPPAQRHERIFEAYAGLSAGTGFVLVNDHDPKPLYHQFTAEAGPAFHWEYRQEDPGEFRVLIGKAEGHDAAGSPEATADGSKPPF